MNGYENELPVRSSHPLFFIVSSIFDHFDRTSLVEMLISRFDSGIAILESVSFAFESVPAPAPRETFQKLYSFLSCIRALRLVDRSAATGRAIKSSSSSTQARGPPSETTAGLVHTGKLAILKWRIAQNSED